MSKKKRKPTIRFNTILAQYENNNFNNVLNLLKKARLSPKEAENCKQIKVECLNQLAIEFFSQYNFDKAMYNAKTAINLKFKDKNEESDNYSRLIIGLSLLYSGKFNDATITFSKAKYDNSASSFIFYYILSRLYSQEFVNKSYDEFVQSVGNVYDNINQNRKYYLDAVFYWFDNDLDASLKKIKQIKGESHSQVKNIETLLAFLEETRRSKPISVIKPLYKFLTGISLEPEEKNFLSKQNGVSEYINDESEIHRKYEADIQRLCEKGIPIEEDNFDFFLNTCQNMISQNTSCLTRFPPL